MGSYEIVPNLYVIFVGPAGGPRKTTTVDYSLELLARLPQIKRAADLTSKEDLVDTLLKTEGCAMSIIAGELGEFFAKSGPEMFGTLTNLYDAKRDLTVSTLSRSVQYGEKPCVNLIGATTNEWIASHVPESVIGGGFASRVIFIFEEDVRRRELYYDYLDHDTLIKHAENLTDDLHHIAGLVGDYTINKEARSFMDDWYKSMMKPNNRKLHGYWNRRHVHAHKVAMCLKAAYSDDLTLTKKDFEDALELLKEIEIKLPQVFEAIGKNKYVVDIKVIAAYIRNKQRVSKAQIISEFYSYVEPGMVEVLINALIDMGDLIAPDIEYEDEKAGTGAKVFYKWIGE